MIFVLLDNILVGFVLNLTSFENYNLQVNSYHKLTRFPRNHV